MDKACMRLYEDEMRLLDRLPDKQFAHIIRAMLRSSLSLTIPELSEIETALLALINEKHDRQSGSNAQ